MGKAIPQQLWDVAVFYVGVSTAADAPLAQARMVLVIAGLRARCLCAQGDLVGAVAVARHGLQRSQHDSLAAFLHLQGGVPGAHLALMGLQGLSLEMEAELCMATGGTAAQRTTPGCCLHGVLEGVELVCFEGMSACS